MSLSKQHKAEWGLFGLTLLWGISFPLTKNALNYWEPFDFLLVRFFIAWVCVGCFWLFFRRKTKNLGKNFFINSFILALVLFLGFFLQTTGQQYISSGRAALITGLSTLFVFVLEWAFLRKNPGRWVFLGLILNILGLLCLNAPVFYGQDLDVLSQNAAKTFQGDIRILGCAVLFAAHIVLITKIAHKHPTPAVSAAQMSFMLVFSLIAVLFNRMIMGHHGPLPFASFLWESMWSVTFLAVFVTALTLLAHTKLQKQTSPTRAALIFALEPVHAALFAWLISNEKPTLYLVAGGGLMISGAVMASVKSKTMPS